MNIEAIPNATEADQTVEAAISIWQQSNLRLEAEFGELSASQELPDWWYESQRSRWGLVDNLKNSPDTGQYVATYHNLNARENELKEKIAGRSTDSSSPPIESTIYMLGPEVVAEGMRFEGSEGMLHTDLLENLSDTNDKRGFSTKQLETLQAYYGLDSLTDLLSVGGDEFSNEVRKCLLHENTLKWINHEENRYDSDKTFEENKLRDRTWMAHALASGAHIDIEEAAPYVFSGVIRNHDNKNLIKIIEAFDYFGAERLKSISQATGIYGLEAYSIPQLERMERFVVEPDELAKELADRDVTVVLNNRVGDHNGAISNTSELFEDDNNTLFFEINTMGDIYRKMSLVHKAGIRPSSLVLAAHSNKGQFMVSDDRDPSMRRRDIATIAGKKLVEFTTSNKELLPGDRAYAMEGMKGMARLIDDYMQPSRGIDDDESNTGRKKIIFQACNMATETERRELDNKNEKEVIGMESVISRLGADITNNGTKSNVDIYGAATGLQMHRTEHGVSYSGQPEDGTLDRVPVKAVLIRVENGSIQQQEVDEIITRK